MNWKNIFQTSKKIFTKTQKRVVQIKKNIDQLKNDRNNKKIEVKKRTTRKKSVPERTIVDLSISSVVKATLAILGLLILTAFLYEIREILILIFVALFFSAAIDPVVDKMEIYNIPRWLGMIFVYIFMFALILLFITEIIPLVADQIKAIAINIQNYLENLYFLFVTQQISIPLISSDLNQEVRIFVQDIQLEQIIVYVTENLGSVQEYLKNLTDGSIEALKTAGSAVGETVSIIFTFLFKFIIFIFLVFFMVVEKHTIGKFFVALFPTKYNSYIVQKSAAIQSKIGSWVNGTLALSFSMFVLSLIGLLIFNVEYALTLALLTGLADFIPYVGPFIAYLTILPVAIQSGDFTFLWITLWFIGIQQIEANILIPVIMKRAVGLSPVVVMIAMLIGFQFLGIIGVIIAIPLTTSIAIFIQDYVDKNTKGK